MNRDTQHCDAEELALAALGERTDIDVDHLAACEQCQEEIASLRRVVRITRGIDDDTVTAPSATVWENIRTAMDETGSVMTTTDRPASAASADGDDAGAAVIPMRRRTAPWIALAAAVGVLLGAVAGALVVTRSPAEPTLIAQTALEPLDGFAATGEARVQMSDSGEAVSIDLRNLPETEGYFEVWLLTEDASAMVSLGAVGPGERSTLPLPPGLELARFNVVDVSAEEFDGDPTHSAISVVRGTLSV